MRIIDVEQNTEEWFEERKGKISGTRLGDVYSTRAYTKADLINALTAAGLEVNPKLTVKVLEESLTPDAKLELLRMAPRKLGFYEILAERIATPADDEERRARGHRLEDTAIEEAEKILGFKTVKVGICVSDRHPGIINSPDAYKKPIKKVYSEAIEAKCLSSARHLQAVIENRIPDEFEIQKMQYFVVNKDLKKLHFAFHDDRIIHKELQTKVITVTREEIGEEAIQLFEDYQVNVLEQIDKLVGEYAF